MRFSFNVDDCKGTDTNQEKRITDAETCIEDNKAKNNKECFVLMLWLF